jgi:HK97 family phage major capsid protein
MTEPQARAKGYIKGNKKTDIQMAILNRVTTPTTVYIKNEIDRDDVIDITDFDVVAWQKREMRKQLDKDLARAILVGDGRNPSDADKINEGNIRPILTDDDMYTIKYSVNDGRDYDSSKANDSVAKGIIRAAIRARKQYKGSGSPVFYTKEDVVTDMLLIEDLNGRRIYNTEEDLARALRVKEIVTVPELDNYANTYGIIVNLADYTAGADKGGSINMFDDFDIDYNQMKYLIETRMSGALTVPYSAIALNVQSSGNNATEPEDETQG